MNRLLDQNDKNMDYIASDIRNISEKLNGIDTKLTILSAKFESLEKSLNKEQGLRQQGFDRFFFSSQAKASLLSMNVSYLQDKKKKNLF